MWLWIVLAALFLSLAIVNWVLSRPLQKDAKNIETQLGFGLSTSVGIPTVISKSLRLSTAINTIGFLLASAAAIFSALE